MWGTSRLLLVLCVCFLPLPTMRCTVERCTVFEVNMATFSLPEQVDGLFVHKEEGLEPVSSALPAVLLRVEAEKLTAMKTAALTSQCLHLHGLSLLRRIPVCRFRFPNPSLHTRASVAGVCVCTHA